MRVILLDFDGVLHEARGDLPQDRYFAWLPILVELLEPHPDVRVAVHSSWRHMHTAEELADFMRLLGDRYIGTVPRGDREPAIREFLKSRPDVRRYLVIDDAPDEFSRIQGRRLVLCDPERGLSAADVQSRIREWLQA